MRWKWLVETYHYKIIDFKKLEEDGIHPPKYKHITYHIRYKMDMTRKDRLVAGWYLNDQIPPYVSYLLVFERDSALIRFLISTLNNLYIITTDICSFHIYIEPKEIYHVTLVSQIFGTEYECISLKTYTCKSSAIYNI